MATRPRLKTIAAAAALRAFNMTNLLFLSFDWSLFDSQRVRLARAKQWGKLIHRIARLWHIDLWTWIVELRRYWLLGTYSGRPKSPR